MMTLSPGQTVDVTIALVGNPNAGKTSLFNALTGAKQKTGNYPGVTVEVAEGKYETEVYSVNVVDVPGLYSLNPVSADEEIASQIVKSESEPPDILIYVLDSTNLERNLYLFTQVAELGMRMVVAVTMTDLLIRQKEELGTEKLGDLLGVPVVAVVPHKGVGITKLRAVIEATLKAERNPVLDIGYPQILTDAVERLIERFARHSVELTSRESRCLILEKDCPTYERFSKEAELTTAIDDERQAVLGAHGHGRTLDAQARYAWSSRVTKQSINKTGQRGETKSEKIDRVLTHRFWGLIVFVGIMYAVFQSIYTVAKPLMWIIESGVDWFADLVSKLFSGSSIIESLVVDGLIKGVGTVLEFLPQIIILFFFIAVLEGTGYLARAAFLMDRLLGWCGLNGRAFIPLLSSFACAVPGIMAARVMPDERSRLATILVAPLMSCSARLPVYVMIIGTFIEPKFGPFWAGVALFGMHFVGIFVAIPVVYILNRGVLKGKRLPFMLELPKYQWPKWRDIGITIVSRVKVFVNTAGTIIVAMSILIWAALSFPQGDKAAYHVQYLAKPATYQARVSEDHFALASQRRDSFLGRFGRAVEPAFIPAGFDWRLTTAILAAFPAREVVVSAMGIIFETGDNEEGGKDLNSALEHATWPDGRKLLTPWTAVGLMVFFALCCQCMATLAAIRRETNSWKWPIFAFTYMTVLAYVAAVLIQVVGKAVGG